MKQMTFKEIVDAVKQSMAAEMKQKYGLEMKVTARSKEIDFGKHTDSVSLDAGVCIEDFVFTQVYSSVGYHELQKVILVVNIVEGRTDESALKHYKEYSTIDNTHKYALEGLREPKAGKRELMGDYTLEQFIADFKDAIEQEAMPFFEKWSDMNRYYQLLTDHPQHFIEPGQDFFETYDHAVKKAAMMALLGKSDYMHIIEEQKAYYQQFKREDGSFVPRYYSLMTLTRLLNEYQEKKSIALPPVESLINKTYH
jgi:hypothetical protein